MPEFTISQINKMVLALGYSGTKALINEWVVGMNAERDREIMCYRLLDGLSIEDVTARYADAHPSEQISKDTVKRAILDRNPQIFKHFPG